MKRFFTFLAACLLAGAAATASPLDNILIPSDSGRKVSLNGKWDFQFIAGNDWSAFSGFYKNNYDSSTWDKIPVPGCWDALGYLRARYTQPEDVTGLYRTTFTVPADWKGSHIYLNLDGVLRGYDLWVNGKYVGSWELANNSCQFDITKYARTGSNTLAMRVYTRYMGYEFDSNDDWGQVGIHRNVTLFSVPRTHIKDLKVTSTVAADNSAKVRFAFEFDTFGAKLGKNAVLKAEVRCPHNSLKDSFEIPVDGAGVTSADHVWETAAAHLWTAETPALYTLNCSLWENGKEIETFSQKFGIREIRIEGDKLYLNNSLFKLRGVTEHATDPRNGKVISDELTLKDMRMMKEANINFIRTSHYPREPRFYELADSLGFYVMDEVPFGFGDRHLTDSSYQDNLILRAQATLVRDKNHPSVIIWSVGNENPLTPITEVTGQYVQKMDPSRPICYPMMDGYFKLDLPDFIDIYAPHYPSVRALNRYASATNRPMIATEYCHTLGQALEEHHEMWEIMQANDNLVGGSIWEWVDQGMPDHESEWPGRFAKTYSVWLSETDAIKMEGNQGTDGIVYATRDPLPNYFNVRHNYAQAYILTENLAGADRLAVDVENRYDFLNLKDKVVCNWAVTAGKRTVAQGSLSPDCAPHQRRTLEFEAPLDGLTDTEVCLLTVSFTEKNEGYALNERSFRLNSDEQYSAIVGSLGDGLKSARSAASYTSDIPLWRTGRKPSLSEDLHKRKKGGDYVLKYLMKGGDGADGNFRFANSEIAYDGYYNRATMENGTVKYSFNLKPDRADKLILEAGLAILLDKDLKYFQWLGKGPYTAYPAKDNANLVGVHALQAGDLYFEGNKIGVDALLCTDKAGNGLLFISTVDDVNFEETDEGVVVSFNPVVSGLGAKWNVTGFPVYSQDLESINGVVYAIPVEAGRWSEKLKGLFKDPSEITRFSPFISQYDTYLMKMSDIIE